MKWLISALALAIIALPAAAAVQPVQNFARDFEAAAYESYSFTKGRSASFYNNTDDHGYGLNVGGILSSTDRAPSLSSGLSFGDSGAAAFEHNAKLTTLLLSGTMDIPGFAPNLLFKPYVLGGVGVALYDTTSSASLAPEARGTDVIPVFKLGGGFAFRMDKMLDLSLAYKAGFASSTMSGRNQDSATIQMIDISLKYKF
jgi:opacity protein-like surface antigen